MKGLLMKCGLEMGFYVAFFAICWPLALIVWLVHWFVNINAAHARKLASPE